MSDVHFGAVDRPLPDWRAAETTDNGDDDESGPTPPDVTEILGFDPAKDDEFAEPDE